MAVAAIAEELQYSAYYSALLHGRAVCTHTADHCIPAAVALAVAVVPVAAARNGALYTGSYG
eukprot:3317-Heterococcus_DN1.PRE.1